MLVPLELVATPLWQLIGTIISVIFALTMVIAVGFITSKLGRKEIPYDDIEEFSV